MAQEPDTLSLHRVSAEYLRAGVFLCLAGALCLFAAVVFVGQPEMLIVIPLLSIPMGLISRFTEWPAYKKSLDDAPEIPTGSNLVESPQVSKAEALATVVMVTVVIVLGTRVDREYQFLPFGMSLFLLGGGLSRWLLSRWLLKEEKRRQSALYRNPKLTFRRKNKNESRMYTSPQLASNV